VKIIDAHLHFSDIESMRGAALRAGLDYSVAGLRLEQEAAGVVLGVCMGINERGELRARRRMTVATLYPAPNPMLPDLTSPLPDNMVWCAGVNAVRLRREDARVELERLDRALDDERAVGIKLYPGYFPYPVAHQVYEPVYELARQHQLPVVVHGGQTYAYGGHDGLAHPEHLTAAARAHPELSFVLAHMGYPWFAEAAAAARSAPNIAVDLSGLVEGGLDAIAEVRRNREERAALSRALEQLDDWDRVMFGTDWPLTPIAAYRDLIVEHIPEGARQRVFFDNAARLFPRLQRFLP
jgi:predicted TIM-barrel fold metal-dependent hydrolase